MIKNIIQDVKTDKNKISINDDTPIPKIRPPRGYRFFDNGRQWRELETHLLKLKDGTMNIFTKRELSNIKTKRDFITRKLTSLKGFRENMDYVNYVFNFQSNDKESVPYGLPYMRNY